MLGWALGLYPFGSAMIVLVPIITVLAGLVAGLWGPWGRADPGLTADPG